MGWVGRVLGGFWGQNPGLGFYAKPSAKPNFIGLKLIITLIITLIIANFSSGFNIRTSCVKMGWVGLGPRIFDLPNVGLGTYFRQPNQPNNPLGQGNPSGRPYRAGTLNRSPLPLHILVLILPLSITRAIVDGGDSRFNRREVIAIVR